MGPTRLALTIVAASTVVRLALAWGFLGFTSGDDVEILETGFRQALGLAYEPWAIRNLLLPALTVAPAVAVGAAAGITEPALLVRLALVPFVALGSLAVWLVWRLGAVWAGERVGLLAAALYAVHPLALAYGSAAYPRVASAAAVLGAALLMARGGRDLARGGAAGALLALAFAARYSEAIFLAPAALLAPAAGGPWGRRLLGLAGGFAVGALLAVGLWDAVTWGEPFASLGEFARYTLVEKQASARVAEQGAGWYLRRLPKWLPLAAVPLLAFAPRRQPLASAWLFVVLPVAALSAIHHKEMRYLQAVVPFVALLAAAGGAALWERGRRRTAAALVALVALTGAAGAWGVVGDRSLAAVAAARAMAGEPGVATVALSQAWAYGHLLFLGPAVGQRDLATPPSPAALAAALPGADRVALYREDLEAVPALAEILAAHGLRQRAFHRRAGAPEVVVFGP